MIVGVLRRYGNTDPLKSVSLVDIGYNIGTFTVVAAALGYHVLAVDAMERNLQVLDTSLRVNNLVDRVTLVHNAMSDTREKLLVSFYPPLGIMTLTLVCIGPNGCGPGSSRIRSYHNHDKTNPLQSEAYAVMMDDVIPLVRTQRVLVKMDIEAAEGRALRGAKKFFDQLDVVGVLMEWALVKGRVEDRDFFISFMSARGYSAYPSPFDNTLLVASHNMSWPGNIYWRK
nr:hypothetical protein BaRGS_031200 [Batillaria attramentaria]